MSTETLKDLMRSAEAWPAEDQQELADYARVIEARRAGLYKVSDAERAAIAEGIAEADRGEFAADELVAVANKRHGL